MTTHASVLVSGKAGTGKTVLLRNLRRLLVDRGDRVVAAAPTGVAAVNIDGMTLHGWLGMGLAERPLPELKAHLTARARKALTNTDVLLIDEISMVDPEFFQVIAHLAAWVRKSNQPFGGLRLVMFGDFLQLPPIAKNTTTPLRRFVFQTPLWASMHVQRLVLDRVYRQDQPAFLALLNDVRIGVWSSKTKLLLRMRCRTPPEPFTRLCNYRTQVLAYNTRKLAALTGTATTFEATVRVQTTCDDDLPVAKAVRGSLDKVFPVLSTLVLKVGTQVMMRSNVHLKTHSVCNGSIGTVLSIDRDGVVVQFSGGAVRVERYAFQYQASRTVKVTMWQFPLCMSWAMTIHKSQGLTIDRVLVDTNCFESGQLYTAFARVRALEDLFLTSVAPDGLKWDAAAAEFES